MAAPLESLYELALLLRRHAAEHVVAIYRGIDLCGSIERGGIHIGIRTGNPNDLRDTRDGPWVVTRDDIELYALLAEVSDGLSR